MSTWLTWLPAALPAALALALLLLPGWAVARAAGARGLLAAASAPGLSVTVLGVAAVLAGAAGVSWSPLPVAVLALAATTAALVLGRWVRRVPARAAGAGPARRGAARPASAPRHRAAPRRAEVALHSGGASSVALLERPVTAPPTHGPAAAGTADVPVLSRRALREAERSGASAGSWRRAPQDAATRDWVVAVAAVAGLALATALTLPRTLAAIGTPGAVSQSFDAVFHLNAVRQVLETGDASSLTLGTLTAPGAEVAFYPAAWHGLVALVAQGSGAGIDVATNATAVAVVALWPLPLAALVRAVAGRRPVAVALGAALPAAFVAAPQLQLEWGVLYPLVLSSLALPAALALLVTGLDRTRGPRERATHVVLALAVVPGMVLAQTSTVFALGVLALPLGVAALLGWAGRRSGIGRSGWAVALAGVLASAGVVAAGWAWVDSTAAVESLRTTDWTAEATWPQALRQAVVLGYVNRPAAVVPAAAVLAGLVLAATRRGWRWLAVAHVLGSALYVFAWGVDSELSQVLTGFWYNDGYRLPVLPVVTGVPLAALALWQATALLERAVRPARRQVPWVQLAGCAVALLAAAVAAQGTSVERGYAELAENHAVTDDPDVSDMLARGERALIDRVPQHVPEGVAVATNPWNGSALVYALAGRRTPFPHLQHRFDPARTVVAQRLAEVATDPSVCPALRELGVGYVLDLGPGHLWGGDTAGRDRRYPGLAGLQRAEGFEVADQEGPARLYRITACGA